MRESVITLGQEERTEGGFSAGFLLSLVLHSAIAGWLVFRVQPEESAQTEPVRFVELVGERPSVGGGRTYTEAPGPAIEQPPSRAAPLSNANRRAMTPEPSGASPTRLPGPVGPAYVPGSPAALDPPSASTPAQAGRQARENESDPEGVRPDGAVVYETSARSEARAATTPDVDWRNAIREMGKVASLGTGSLGQIGGERGIAETGPVSFETRWFAWGDYADGMVRRIRYHWYNNMPELIRLGIKGVTTIRFTIQRDGRITDLELLKSSGSPPYDFAARKAIELSSPLAPLPANFPGETERVTASFYYNLSPPR